MAGSTPTEPLPEGVFEGREAFEDRVRALLRAAAPHGVRRIDWVSQSPLDWPLEDDALLQELTGWLRPAGRLWCWVAPDLEPLRHCRPRLTRWRATWGHRLRCLSPDEPGLLDGPGLLLLRDLAVLALQDPLRWRGRVSGARSDLQQAAHQVDAVLQRSTESFPVTTLGI